MTPIVPKMRNKSTAIVISCGLLIAGGGLAQQKTVAAKPAAAVKKPVDPFLNGPPLKFDQVLRLLRQTAIPLRRRKEAIQHRGLAFSLSPASLDKLKSAGASEDMLEVIKSKAKPENLPAPAAAVPAPPPPPAPPPKPPSGKLALRCVPAECEVSLNETPRGVTQNGSMEIAEVVAGQWTIEFKKNGYLDRQTVVTVEPDRTVSVSESLSPTRATQEALGTELFQKVVSAVGNTADKGPFAVEASGSTTTWSGCDGQSVRWMLWMRNQPDFALFQLMTGPKPGKDALREVAFSGTQYKTGKKLKGQEAIELATDAGLIRDHQLSALIAKLSSVDFKLLAIRTTPTDGEPVKLIAEGSTEKISVTLGDDLLPRESQIATATGVGAATVTYSDYFKLENIAYPKTMQIKPEGWQHGLEVHFDKATLKPKLAEAEFKPRKKPLSDFGN
jgi:PEGA domain-containing protein